MQYAPPRSVWVTKQRRILRGWSDAEHEMKRPELGGGLGYIIQDGNHNTVGACKVTAAHIAAFLPRKQQIGQLEALVPYVAMLNHPELLAGCDVLWGVDNTSAEAGLIRGYSSKADTANLIAATHIVMARRDIRAFWFHVDSESNPADGPSRDGLQDLWTMRMIEQHG